MKLLPALAIALAATACGGGGSSPTAPTQTTPPVQTQPAQVEVRLWLYNSIRGPVGTVSKTLNKGAPLQVRTADLGVSGVDSKFVVVRERNVGGLIGNMVAAYRCIEPPCLSQQVAGEVTFVPTGTDYDIFLMDDTTGVNYACLDDAYGAKAELTLHRDTTLRRLSPGQVFHEYSTRPASPGDEPFVRAARMYSEALSPFGLRYGSISFVQSGEASLVGGYADIPHGGLAYWTEGILLLWTDDDERYYPVFSSMQTRSLTDVAVHELTHVLLGVIDAQHVPACGGKDLDQIMYDEDRGTFTPQGKAAVAFWALIRR
jgi:hypothetical protein